MSAHTASPGVQITSQKGSDGPIKVLSLDGGGFRGLSSLLILRQIMLLLGEVDKPARPCDVFDLIVGTSTGGLIALMLGRLAMTIDEAFDKYIELGPKIFGDGAGAVMQKISLEGKFDHTALATFIQELSRGKMLVAGAAEAGTKTVVTTSSTALTTMQVQLLRSYGTKDIIQPHGHKWTVTEAARATSAAPTFFDPLFIQQSSFEDSGASGCNNPVKQAVSEAARVWENDHKKRKILVVSIGTGISSIIRRNGENLEPTTAFKNFFGQTFKIAKNPGAITKRGKDLMDHFVKIATNTVQAHMEMYEKYDEAKQSHLYFRFDTPEIGDFDLADVGKSPAIQARTATYLDSPEVKNSVKSCVERLKISPPTDSLTTRIDALGDSSPDPVNDAEADALAARLGGLSAPLKNIG